MELLGIILIVLGAFAYCFFDILIGFFAKKKGRSWLGWFLFSLFTTPVLAGVVLLLVGNKDAFRSAKGDSISFKKIITIIIIAVLAMLMVGGVYYVIVLIAQSKAEKANTWGSYDGEPILIENNNVFYNTLVNDSNFQTAYLNNDYNSLLQSYYNAYQSQVVFTALTQEAQKAKIVAPQKLVNDLIIRAGVYNGSDGKFSEEIYKNASETEKNQVNAYYTNYYPFNLIQSDLMTTIVTPQEADFVASLAEHTRSFEYFIINYMSYPDDLAASYGNEHSDLFRTMGISLLTVHTEEELEPVLEALNSGAAWEDVVAEYSESSDSSSNGGKVGDVKVFSLLTILADEADLEKITSLEAGAYSEPITDPYGYYVIFRADTAIREADFTDEEELAAVKYYLSQNDPETIKAYIEENIGDITAQAQSDFEAAASAVNSTIYAVNDAVNNIGGSDYLGGIDEYDDTQYLAAVAQDEAVVKELFSAEEGYVTGALEVTDAASTSFIVVKVTDIKDDNEDNSYVTVLLYSYYAPIQPRDDRFYNVLNSDKHTDNFYNQFLSTLFPSDSSSST